MFHQQSSSGGHVRAILDIDVHHGNGTQDIFHGRGDVFFASLPGAPEDAYPYFLGHADETGTGDGEGTTANYPMPPGTGHDLWAAALDEALVVSLGADAYKEDPISLFKLGSPDFTDAGRRVAVLGLSCVFCMEGGYAIEAAGGEHGERAGRLRRFARSRWPSPSSPAARAGPTAPRSCCDRQRPKAPR